MVNPIALNTAMMTAGVGAFDKQKTKKMVAQHEGREPKVYLDTKKHPTIGVGFNLDRKDAREQIEAVGGNYDRVRSGKDKLTDDQIDTLFEKTFNEVTDVAKRFTDKQAVDKDGNAKQKPTKFDDHPDDVQSILIDMAMMGEGSLSGFKKFKDALDNKDYKTAAKEMVDSKWYKQVETRGKDLEEMMKKVAAKKEYPNSPDLWEKEK